MSGQGFIIPLDPETMARQFACEDPSLKALIDGPEPESEYSQDRRIEDVIIPLLELLPPREADMMHMSLVQHKRQTDIAYVFGMTQAAVSYKLNKAMQRLKFLVEIPKLTTEEILKLITPHFVQMDLDILLTYRESTCQSDTADTLKLTQGRVRHRLFKAVDKLQLLAETDPSMAGVAKLFTMLRDNHNILNAIFLPQWKDKGTQARDDSMGKPDAKPKRSKRGLK